MIIGSSSKKGVRIGRIDQMSYRIPNIEGIPIEIDHYRIGVEVRGKSIKIHIPKTFEVLSIQQVLYRSLLSEEANFEADYIRAHWQGVNEAFLYNVLGAVLDKKRGYVKKQGYAATPTSLILPPEVGDPFKSKDDFVKALPLWREEEFALLYEFYWTFSDKKIEIVEKKPLKRIRKLSIEPAYIQQISDILAVERFRKARENQTDDLGDLERAALSSISRYDERCIVNSSVS